MPDREALRDLLGRVEAATGPDREIDADLHEMAGGCAHRETEYYCIEDGNDSDSGFTCKRCRVDMYGRRTDVKPVAASLDAALALVERVLPGWKLAELKDGIRHDDGPYCHVRLWCPVNPALGYRYPANGKTPALAVLAALLKAKLAEVSDE